MKKRDLYYERIPTKLLREDVRFLGTFLGKVIKDQEGVAFYKIVEKDSKIKSQYGDGLNIVFAGNIGVAQSFDTIIEAVKILTTKLKSLVGIRS